MLALLCLLLAAPAVSWAEPAPAPPHTGIPFKSEPKSTGRQFGETLLALIVVGGLAVGGLYVMRRYLPTMALKAGAGKRLQLLETMRLTPKTTVFLIKFDNTTLLLGQHGDSLSVLASNPADSRADSETQHV